MLSADDKRFEYFADMLPDSAAQVAIIYDPNHSGGCGRTLFAQSVGYESPMV
jgi:hypothetical protein